MVRITIIEILSFLLPFLIFLVWRWQSDHDSLSRPTPVLKLAAIGGAIGITMLIGLVIFDSVRAGRQGDQYVPARMVDGELVPGYFIPAEEVGQADADEDPEEETDEEPEDPPQ